jgi:hypothetical protein
MALEIAAYPTAATVINQVAAEIGLPTTAGNVDPYTSTNPIHQRLCALMKSTGSLLKGMHEWQSLEVVYNLLTAVGDTGVYSLPTDFVALTDQTGWQKNYFWPLRGPYSAQMWQQVINYPTTGIYIAFRIQNNQLWLWPQPPPTGVTISFVYKSAYWTIDGVTNLAKSVPTQGSDVVAFNELLIVCFLKLRYLQSIGHDTTAAEAEFKLAFDMGTSQSDGAAPVLELSRNTNFPFLSSYNAPDVGYGGQPSGAGYQ